VESRTLHCRKKLEFQLHAFKPPNSRSVSFGSARTVSVLPSSDRAGAIGICFVQDGNRIIVRSLNADGPAAADGRIVPGDAVVAGLSSSNLLRPLL
jgi:hypothetical protein